MSKQGQLERENVGKNQALIGGRQAKIEEFGEKCIGAEKNFENIGKTKEAKYVG